MKDRLVRQVRRVEVTDQVATARPRPCDYADAFEVRMPEPDREAPEAWVLTGMEQVPAWVEWISWLLPDDDEWRVVESTSEVVRLEQSDPLMHVVLVGRRVGPFRRRLTTVLTYKRPVLARLVWAVLGVGHRRMARRVITSKSSTAIRVGGSERAS